jgi:hypothetical protein
MKRADRDTLRLSEVFDHPMSLLAACEENGKCRQHQSTRHVSDRRSEGGEYARPKEGGKQGDNEHASYWGGGIGADRVVKVMLRFIAVAHEKPRGLFHVLQIRAANAPL